jgi:hypothetical protein
LGCDPPSLREQKHAGVLVFVLFWTVMFSFSAAGNDFMVHFKFILLCFLMYIFYAFSLSVGTSFSTVAVYV